MFFLFEESKVLFKLMVKRNFFFLLLVNVFIIFFIMLVYEYKNIFIINFINF